jgi:hypothetical protein
MLKPYFKKYKLKIMIFNDLKIPNTLNKIQKFLLSLLFEIKNKNIAANRTAIKNILIETGVVKD